jgi:hypothetical protein
MPLLLLLLLPLAMVAVMMATPAPSAFCNASK